MKKIILYSLSILILITHSTACRKKELDECPACPKINSISRDNGHKGDTVVINGKNFSVNVKENIVKFNGTTVAVSDMISGSTSELKVRVPAKCGTGPVTVILDDELYSEPGPIFTYVLETKIARIAGGDSISGNTGTTNFLDTRFNLPSQVAVDALNNIYVLDAGNKKVRKLDATTLLSTVLSDNTSQASNPTALVVDEKNIVYVSSYDQTSFYTTVYKFSYGATSPAFHFKDFDKNRMHVSLTSQGNGQLYIGRTKTDISSFAPEIVHFSSTGIKPFVADAGDVVFYKNGFIYQIYSINEKFIHQSIFSKYVVADTTEVMLIDEKGGLDTPLGLVADEAGNVYIADTQNNRVLKYSATGAVTTVIAGLVKPQGLALDKEGNLYVAETGRHCIKKITFE